MDYIQIYLYTHVYTHVHKIGKNSTANGVTTRVSLILIVIPVTPVGKF